MGGRERESRIDTAPQEKPFLPPEEVRRREEKVDEADLMALMEDGETQEEEPTK